MVVVTTTRGSSIEWKRAWCRGWFRTKPCILPAPSTYTHDLIVVIDSKGSRILPGLEIQSLRNFLTRASNFRACLTGKPPVPAPHDLHARGDEDRSDHARIHQHCK